MELKHYMSDKTIESVKNYGLFIWRLVVACGVVLLAAFNYLGDDRWLQKNQFNTYVDSLSLRLNEERILADERYKELLRITDYERLSEAFVTRREHQAAVESTERNIQLQLQHIRDILEDIRSQNRK